MKRVQYNLWFDNQFTSRDYYPIIWLPFWWSNKKIVAYLIDKKEYNYTNICWVKVFGKRVWEHTMFRDKNYKGIKEDREQLLELITPSPHK